MAGIYLHIPFCKQACSYCDFYFITSLQFREPFVERLIGEINSYRGTPFADHTFETIYLGGGTPSMLSLKQLDRILGTLRNTFEIDPKEITMEMNPDNVTAEYLEGLLDLGIQRASMGVQSFQPELLEFMHRAHTREEALECFEILAKTGFPSYSVDLIYGNPNQSLDQLDQDLQQLIEFDPPHVSAYSLTIEPNTRLGKQHDLGRLKPLPDEKVSEHYDLVLERLVEAGIQQYEVSNYSKPGWEALHNSGYWTHQNYLGLGPAAHSFWWPEGSEQAVRWENKPDIRSYLSGQSGQKVGETEDISATADLSDTSDVNSTAPPLKPSAKHSNRKGGYADRQININQHSGPDKKDSNEHEEMESSDQKFENAGKNEADYQPKKNACPTPEREEEYLNLKQLAEERIMMGLRTREGLSQQELKQHYKYPLNQKQVEYLEQKKQEHLVRSANPIRLTDKGLKIADSIILDLVTLGEKGQGQEN